MKTMKKPLGKKRWPKRYVLTIAAPNRKVAHEIDRHIEKLGAERAAELLADHAELRARPPKFVVTSAGLPPTGYINKIYQ